MKQLALIMIGTNMQNFLIVGFILAIIIGAPFATIASMNVLFALEIPFNLTTWFAALWLSFVVGGKVASSKK